MNKTLKVMTSAALLAGVVAPVASTTVSADSKNFVDKVLYVSDDYEANGENNLYIEKDRLALTSGDTFRLTLPSGVKWDADYYNAHKAISTGFVIVSANEQDLQVKVDGNWTDTGKYIPLYFDVDGAEGEVKVTVDARGSKVTGGQYTIAVVAAGATKTTIAGVATIGSAATEIKTIRIDETAIGAIDKNEKITLTLPSKFKWDLSGAPVAQFTGGLKGTAAISKDNGSDRKISFIVNGESTSAPGTIYISGLKIDAEKGAPKGDVEVSISGSGKVTGEDLIVAKYTDYSTTVEIGDVPTLLAGRSNSEDADDLKLAKLTLKEDIVGSWITDREVNVEFPSWVKVVGIKASKVKGFDGIASDQALGQALSAYVDPTSNEFEFTVPKAKTDEKREVTIEFYVSVQADVEGDITAVVSGKAGLEGELVLGKVVSPVSLETTPANVKTGIKNQALNDIVITEAQKGAFIEKGTVSISLGDNVQFSEEPKVEVTEGNLEIEKVDIDDNGNLTFKVKSSSTKASKIVISGIKADLDRTIPEGDVKVSIGGDALVRNNEKDLFKEGLIGHSDYDNADANNTIDIADFGTFKKGTVAKKVIATVVTPADGNASATEVKLTIGSTSYTVGTETKTADVAPFVEAGRTYLPVRVIAEAIGADSIQWNNATQTALVKKGSTVAAMTIGKNEMLLNGTQWPMDAKAQLKNGRTFLPVRALGEALGATVTWDEATQTVTVK